MTKIIFVSLIVFTATQAHAQKQKCFKSETAAELAEVFPLVVRATVEERIAVEKSKTDFKIRFRIDAVLKGETKQTTLEATEGHTSETLTVYHLYKTGESYVVPADVVKKGAKKAKASAYRAVLPADGCPALPREASEQATESATEKSSQ